MRWNALESIRVGNMEELVRSKIKSRKERVEEERGIILKTEGIL